jgi:pantoate--beta-alanine ligase
VRETGDIPTLRDWIQEFRAEGYRIGFVPTMGGLHEGHLSLVDRAKEMSDRVVMSIFVNPTQFGPGEDFERYPRDLVTDRELAETRGVDLLFTPETETLYPDGDPLTYIDMHRLPEPLCGASRPGHFQGVMTIVAKLLNLVRPDLAVLGQKDIQQLVVIKRMVRDLDIPVEIVEGSTVRETDGLAMSSRNRYLRGDERKEALRLYRSLERAREIIEDGERESGRILREMDDVLRGGSLKVDYISVVRFDDLQEIARIEEKVIIAVAAFAGATRLIDNMIVDFEDDCPFFSL